MKTIKLLFTATVVAIAAIATAVEKPKMNVVPVNADRAIISITNEKAAYFELSIHAQNGDLVYYKLTTEPLTTYHKVYDFENLENGQYTLNLKINDTNLSRNLDVNSNGFTIGESKLSFDPYFAFDGKTLKMTFLNFDKANFNFNLYDEEGLIHESRLGNEFNIISGFDLSKLESGNYKVVLSSRISEYTYDLVK